MRNLRLLGSVTYDKDFEYNILVPGEILYVRACDPGDGWGTSKTVSRIFVKVISVELPAKGGWFTNDKRGQAIVQLPTGENVPLVYHNQYEYVLSSQIMAALSKNRCGDLSVYLKYDIFGFDGDFDRLKEEMEKHKNARQKYREATRAKVKKEEPDKKAYKTPKEIDDMFRNSFK